MHIDLIQLLSGSDIRGYALQAEDGSDPDLTNEAALKIGYTFNKWFEKKFGKKLSRVAIGRDSRVTGENLAQATSMGLIAAGTSVLDTGLATSPAMFMLTQNPNYDVDAAIMITASHMPSNRNGIKIVTKQGGLSSADVREILELGEDIITDFTPDGASRTEIDFIPEYSQNLVRIVREKTGQEKPLEGTHIVVDAGNGAGGFFAEQVLVPLGADISGSRYLEPDGTFPNHIPNPEEKEAIDSIIEAVQENNADMGIIFDTDVDRSAIVDETGTPINKSAFIAFIASLLLEETPGATIVTDSVTSNGLTDFIEAKGGKHHRFKRGYKNVIDEAKRLNAEGQETVLAMETSGHGAVKDNYFLDDGAYLAVLSLVALNKAKSQGLPVSEYLSDFKYPLEEEEIRLVIHDPDFKQVGNQFIEEFKAFALNQPGWSLAEPNYEGIRVNCDEENGNGWILVRLSLHEPKIPVNIESDSEGGVDLIKARFNQFLENYENIK